MGAEAGALGHGGIRAVARAAGVREATVSLGVSELECAVPLHQRAGQSPSGQWRPGDQRGYQEEGTGRGVQAAGAQDYPLARRLLITADAGGSNGYRTRAWKAELAALAVETGLEITCCHFPPGTSKWNKVEHRLFSHITMNWRGRPLTSHEVIVQTIGATTTATGLRVHAELDTASYDTGVKISDRQMEALPLARHDWHGDWNYTLLPCEYDQISTAPDPFDRPSPDLAWLCQPACPPRSGMP